jgi:hypothetical protein
MQGSEELTGWPLISIKCDGHCPARLAAEWELDKRAQEQQDFNASKRLIKTGCCFSLYKHECNLVLEC